MFVVLRANSFQLNQRKRIASATRVLLKQHGRILMICSWRYRFSGSYHKHLNHAP